MKVWICKNCSLLIPSNSMPQSSACPAGGNHQWTIATNDGDVVPRPGLKAWQCRKCGILIYSKNMPNQSVKCPQSGSHQWSQLT